VNGCNLKFYEDRLGLKFTANIYDQGVIKKIERKKIKGCSFAFNCNKNQWIWIIHKGVRTRLLKDIELTEISLLETNSAYESGYTIMAYRMIEESSIEYSEYVLASLTVRGQYFR
jgi:HK97 family phage prohead protease